MPTEFDVQIIKTDVLEEIEGAWQPDHFRAMLEEMDYGDTNGLSDAELREMCLMSLQDLKHDDAAECVLRCRLGDKLRKGQIEDCSHDMLDEKLWEHYAEMTLHEEFFHVGSLLYAAVPRRFPATDAARVEADVRARDAAGREILATPVQEPFVIRLLSDGMTENAVLHRLFGDQLKGGDFPEAEAIIWSFTQERIDGDTLRLTVMSSGYWLDSLANTETYVSRDPQRD